MALQPKNKPRRRIWLSQSEEKGMQEHKGVVSVSKSGTELGSQLSESRGCIFQKSNFGAAKIVQDLVAP